MGELVEHLRQLGRAHYAANHFDNLVRVRALLRKGAADDRRTGLRLRGASKLAYIGYASSMDERIRSRLINALLGQPLVSNAFRGTLVEAIIAEALEAEWSWCADGWGSFDFEGPNGTGLEVKQSAARQGWHDETSCKPCPARFDIAERTAFGTTRASGYRRLVELPPFTSSLIIPSSIPL